MSTRLSSSSSRSTSRQEELEERLVRYQEETNKKVEEKLDTLIELFQNHTKSEGHELLTRRIEVIETEQARQEARPLKTWQIITGIVGILISLGFIFFSLINTTISVILFFHTFVH